MSYNKIYIGIAIICVLIGIGVLVYTLLTTKTTLFDVDFSSNVDVNNIHRLLYDGKNIWFSDFNDSMICVKKSDGSIIRIIKKDESYNFNGIMGLAFDGVNIWVTNSDGNSVTAFNANDGSFFMNLSLPEYGFNNPVGIAFDNINTNMWVTNNSDNSLTCFNSSNGEFIQKIVSDDLNYPNYISCSGNYMWIANNDNTIFGFNTTDGNSIKLTNTLNTLYNFDGCEDITFDGTNMWVRNSGNSSLTGFNASDGSFFMNINNFTDNIKIASCGSNMCVCFVGKIVIFNPKDGSIIHTITEGIVDRYFITIVGDDENIWAGSDSNLICMKIK